MDALYDLKDLLIKELEAYGKKGEMSASVLERVDMLAHATKNLDKVIECMSGEEYSNSDGRSFGRPYDRSYRGRRRDSMGRYSSDGYSRNADMVEKLRRMMDEAPDDRTRQEIQRLITRME